MMRNILLLMECTVIVFALPGWHNWHGHGNGHAHEQMHGYHGQGHRHEQTNCGEKSYPVDHPLHNYPPGHPWHKPELCSKTTTTTRSPITTMSEEDKTLPKPNTRNELENLLAGPLSFLGQNIKNYILGKPSDLKEIKKELNRSFVYEILKSNNRKQQEELKKLKDKIMYLIQEDLKDSINLQNLATSGKLSKILPGASEYILGKKLTVPELKKLKEEMDENIDEAIVDYFGDDRKTDLTPEQLSNLRKELNKKIVDDISNFKPVLTEEEDQLWLTNILSSGKYDQVIPNDLKGIIMGTEYPTPSRLEELIEQIRKIPDIDNEVKTMKTTAQKILKNISEDLKKPLQLWPLDYYNKILKNLGQPNQPNVPVFPESSGSNEYGLLFPMTVHPNQIPTISENELKDMVQTFDQYSSAPGRLKNAKLCCTEE